jgi:hypothetical protein
MRYTLYLFAAFLLLFSFWGCQSSDGLLDPTSEGDSDGQTDWVRPASGYRVCGTVFFDENENGVMDNGEQGIPGVEVDLSNGWVRNTDANGYYCFYPVPNGDYTVDEVVPGGYFPTSPTSVDVTVAGASVGDVDFGLTDRDPNPGPGDGPWSICGTVYWWIACQGRIPAEGVEVTLLLDGDPVTTTYSDENGEYCFVELDNGDYEVQLEDVYVFGGNPRAAPVEDGDVSGIDFRCVPE